MLCRNTVVASAVVLLTASLAPAEELLPLRVLYLGGGDARAGHFETFLKQHFREVQVADRKTFRPEDAKGMDVVLFDWSQSGGALDKIAVPLGKPDDWTTPTVLLNHAGLLIAAHWGMMGGAG